MMIPLFLSNFYPRPPRGGRPVDPLMFTVVPLFLSTPSARRATCLLTLYGSKEGISIHALREEGDGNVPCRRWRSIYFYPRPPRGGRRGIIFMHDEYTIFLSTPSARRATAAPFVGCGLADFYPRPPRGGRPKAVVKDREETKISIHALREEGDQRTMAPAAILS